MTDSAITEIIKAICIATPPTLLAWAALREGKKAVKSIEANTQTTDATAVKIDANTVTTAKIETNTDGNLSRVTAERDVEREKARGYELLIAEMRKQQGQVKAEEERERFSQLIQGRKEK